VVLLYLQLEYCDDISLMGILNFAFNYLKQEQKIHESEVRDSLIPLLSMVYSSFES